MPNLNERATLSVTLVQSELHWHDAEKNRQMFSEILATVAGKTDLVILPEMFTTGFSMTPEQIAEPENTSTLNWMQQQAAKLNAALCGSIAVKGKKGFFNRFYWVEPDGHWQAYDKHHLFRMAGEHEHYQSGQERLIINYLGWRIFPQICYDLRFPVWSRNHNEYDLAIYVANWPQTREHPWQILLQARAIENLCYVAGVNRIGEDGNGLSYSGRSGVIDFKGQGMQGGSGRDFVAGEAFTETYTLEKEALLHFRDAFPAFDDADTFTLQ